VNQLNPQLVSDLARLATRYKPKDWDELAALLDDEARREQLRTLLLELGEVSRVRRKPAQRRRPKAPSRAAELRQSLAGVRREDAPHADLLDGIWLKLRERELLPSIAAVRAFADAMGLKGMTATRRDQAVTELMLRLIDLPGDALEHRMRQTVVEDRKLGEEYEQWVRLILGSSATSPDS